MKQMTQFFLLLFFVFCLTSLHAQPSWTERVQTLAAGEEVVIPNGNHSNQIVKIAGKGTKEKPIIVRAETSGKVFLTGGSQIYVRGTYITVSGIYFKDGGIPTKDAHVIEVAGTNCRITECAIDNYNQDNQGKQWVILFGKQNRYDHNFTRGKTTVDPVFQIEVEEGAPNEDQVDHNYFGPRPTLPDNANGGETMRIGYSKQAYFISRTLVEENLFESCDGEIEIISSKSCENTFRSNTFLHCAGALTLRHGDRCLVEGNLFLQEAKKGSGGIRIIGAGHRIIGNLFVNAEARMGGVINLTAAQVDFKASGYWTVSNVLLENNVILDARGPALALSSMLGGKGGSQTVVPESVTLVGNFFNTSGKQEIFIGTEGKNFIWKNNLVEGGSLGVESLSGKEGISVGHFSVKLDDLKYGSDLAKTLNGKWFGRAMKREEVGPAWAMKL
jgi:poly(beta-D-mannuronate) lyase